MPPEPLSPCDVLIVTASDEFLPDGSGNYIDPVREALRDALQLGRSENYSHNSTAYLPDVRAHKLYVEDRDRYWRLHPRLRQFWGEYLIGRHARTTIAGRSVCVFSSDLRLNTDGPSTPVLRLLSQMVREAEPRLVLHVGLGGGVRAEHQVGDVVVTNRSRFFLRGDLASSPLNGREFGGAWDPGTAIPGGLTFGELREPALLPPSPHYESGERPQPPAHVPRVRVEVLPVLTRPGVTNTLFDIPSPKPGDRDYWGDDGGAVDMDAAPVGASCGDHLPCGFVIGLAMPALYRFDYDYEGSLRGAWAEHLMEVYARAAAKNAATMVRQICENV